MRRPLAEWLSKLKLRKHGLDFTGPCPVCRGRDRFHVQDGDDGLALVGCRGCIDGQSAHVRRASYDAIVEVVFGDGVPFPVATRPRPRRRTPDAGQRAQAMLKASTLDRHPYLIRKGFPDRLMPVLDDAIVIGIWSHDRKLLSAQTIREDGAKKFLPGGAVKGGRYKLGGGRNRFVCEGLATGLSILIAASPLAPRNVEVVVAFSAGNIPWVIQRGDIVIADHDPNGVGEEKARKTGCRWWMPPDVGTDANDYHQRHGIEALTARLREVWKLY